MPRSTGKSSLCAAGLIAAATTAASFSSICAIAMVWPGAAVKDSHPDGMIARGVPPEAIKLAERRLIAINAAWDEIQTQKAA